jgi:hypothetical protein
MFDFDVVTGPTAARVKDNAADMQRRREAPAASPADTVAPRRHPVAEAVAAHGKDGES